MEAVDITYEAEAWLDLDILFELNNEFFLLTASSSFFCVCLSMLHDFVFW